MNKYEKETILDAVEEYIFNLLKYIERREPSSETIFNLTQSLLNINKIKEENKRSV